MITIRKLKSLEEETRLRKATLLLKELSRLDAIDPPYLEGLLRIIRESRVGEDERVVAIMDHIDGKEGRAGAFFLQDLHYRLLDLLGGQTADWDFVDEETSLDVGRRVVCERYLVVDRIRSPFNLGSIFRLADSFGIKKIYIVEGGAEPTHQRTIKVGRGTVETVEYEVVSEDSLLAGLKKSELPLFALESGGVDITEFDFPLAGICVIGSEELGVSPALLDLCDKRSGRVSIALGGTKGSLNVTSASAIMLHG
ncbi:MAG: TrmH family RNA methyltransferase, partial [Spirochaetales bacterium]|nr:TrmH family RNA methyltransferase [Spirochaetales bacterium]